MNMYVITSNTRKLLLLFAPLFLAFSLDAQTYLISEGGTVNSCSATLFDSGGEASDYADNEALVMTFCGDASADSLYLNIVFFDIETNFDFLNIYEGTTASGIPAFQLTGNIAGQSITFLSNCITLEFTSDGSVSRDGFEIQITCTGPTCDDGLQNGDELGIDCGGSDCDPCSYILISEEQNLVSCDAQILDSGANFDYGDNEDYTMTFCSADSASCILIDVNYIDIGFGDHLYIYDGLGTNGFLLADFNATQIPSTIISTAGCVTINFVSDDIASNGGFDMQLSCSDACPTCDDGIQNGEEIGVDCGGPDCPECDFIIMGGTQTTSLCSTTVYDNGFMDDYEGNSNDILTICSDSPGECIQAEFISFEIEGEPWDTFTVYAGPDTDSPVMGVYGNTAPPAILSPGSECLTFQFISDGSVQQAGYEIAITCACPTCNDGVLNGQEVDTDCGGPDCPACDFNIISEEITVTSCDAQLFDSGINSDYGNDEDYTMTFCSDGSGSCLQLDFTSIDIADGDHLYIYDGTDSGGLLLEDITSAQFQETFVAPSGCVTLNFTSDGLNTAGGFDIAVSCTDICPTCDDGIQNGYEIGVDCGGPDCPECDFIVMGGLQTVFTCSTTVYDNGFMDDYSGNANDVLTVCSDTPGECIQAEFISFDVEGEPWDTFTIYAGPDTDSPIIGIYGDLDPPTLIYGPECLTFEFTSDGVFQQEGYEIAITCACPSCDDGVMNGLEIGVDCGGPMCPDCDFNAISEGGTVTSCDATLFDSGIFDNYQGQEDYTMSICSPEVIDSMLVAFQTVSIGIGDHLYIHEGSDIGGEMLADVTAAVNWDDVLVPDACVTFRFVSNDFGESQGFQLGVTCVDDLSTGVDAFESDSFDILHDMYTDEITVKFDRGGSLTMQLSDATGRSVLSKEIYSGERESLSKFDSGVYILSFVSGGELLCSQRIILSH